MASYFDPDFGFSFWYPSSWFVKELSKPEKNYGAGLPVSKQFIVIDDNQRERIAISEFTSPDLAVTLPGGTCGYCAPVTFSFDKDRHQWMSVSSRLGGDVPISENDKRKIPQPADISVNTIGGLHMFKTNQRGDHMVVVPLSARNFVVVTGLSRDGNDISFNDDGVPLATTIKALDPTVATPVSLEERAKVIQKAADAYGISTDSLKKRTTTVTAYITSISGDKITLDYVDVYSGDEADIKMIEDGLCTKRGECLFTAPYVYNRNKNLQLRTFTVSKDAIILSDRDMKLTLSQIASSSIMIYRHINKGSYSYSVGSLFVITFNSKGEIFGIRQVFSP